VGGPGLIDLHHHILPPIYREALQASGVGRTSGIRFPRWTPADSLEVMDRHGIAAAVVSVSTPGVHFGDDRAACRLARACNEYAAELVRAHPARFGAFASLPLPDVHGALAELAYALDEFGLDGVILLSNAAGRYLGDAAFEPVFEELDRRRTTVFLHPTIPPYAPIPGLDIPVSTIEFVADTTRAITNLILSGTLERHPDVPVICAHAGGFAPYVTPRLEAAGVTREQLARLYYDTAASATPETLPSVLALAGTGHLFFGTDYPFAGEPAVAATVAGLARMGVEPGDSRPLLPRLGTETPQSGGG
jgi:predicted TIM-barrel fold metal-dependent hydrolase